MKLQCKLAVNVNTANLECNFVLNCQTIGRVWAGKKDGFSLQNITTSGPNLQKINVVLTDPGQI